MANNFNNLFYGQMLNGSQMKQSDSMTKLITGHINETITNKNRLMYVNKYHKI